MTNSDVEDDCEKENGISKSLGLEKYRKCLGNRKKKQSQIKKNNPPAVGSHSGGKGVQQVGRASLAGWEPERRISGMRSKDNSTWELIGTRRSIPGRGDGRGL